MSDHSNRDDQLERFATRLDWNLLRTYIFIVQQRSITGAAERLCLQQPTVSAALKRLETAVNCKLIERRPGHFALTRAGQKLYEEALSIYRTVSRLNEFMNDSSADVLGHVRIMINSHIVSERFDQLLSRFFREHPKVTLSIEVATTTAIIAALEKGAVTLGVCDGSAPAHLRKRFLLRETYAIYCGRHHPLFGREGLQLEDLRGEAYISFPSDVLGGEQMGPVTALRANASIGQHVRGTSCNFEEVCRMIIAGIGIGALPRHLAEPYLQQRQLWQLPPYHDLPEMDTYMICNPQARFNDGERALLEWFMAD